MENEKKKINNVHVYSIDVQKFIFSFAILIVSNAYYKNILLYSDIHSLHENIKFCMFEMKQY